MPARKGPLPRAVAAARRARRPSPSPAAPSARLIPFLEGMILFEGLGSVELRRIAEILKVHRISPGAYVFREGDAADAVFLVAEGELDVLTSTGTEEFKVNRLRAGDFFGEIALLDQEPRSASVRASSWTRLLELRREDFYHLFRKYPRSTRVILQRLSARMRAMTRELQNQLAALERSNRLLVETYDATLMALSRALDLRDTATEGHSERVTALAVRLAEAAGLSEGDREAIRKAALLHDVGKIGVPDAVLRKPGPLDPAERGVIRHHPTWGYEMLKDIPFLEEAGPVILHHHEKYDGSGYPAGLAGEEIPVGARIFAIVDAYDAMASDRPYRKAMKRRAILQEFRKGAGTHFDPRLIEVFIRKVLPKR